MRRKEWAKAQKQAASAKHREEEPSKKLETTLFEAGQAQSRAKTLDSMLGEAQERASDLKKEEKDLAKWKGDLFEKVDQLRNENEEMENGLRLSAKEIERSQKRITYLDARCDELKEQAAVLAAENETMRADVWVPMLETALETMLATSRAELAAIAAQGFEIAMAKEEAMREMKAKELEMKASELEHEMKRIRSAAHVSPTEIERLRIMYLDARRDEELSAEEIERQSLRRNEPRLCCGHARRRVQPYSSQVKN
jgi:hypothetical protein